MSVRDKNPVQPGLPSSGPIDDLRVHGTFAPWFVTFRLDEELERARRYGRPLAVLVLTPKLAPGQTLTSSAWTGASMAATRSARRIDLVGWTAAEQIVIAMPETTSESAQAVVDRLEVELQRQSASFGGQEWRCSEVADPCSFGSAAALLASLAEDASAA